MNKARRRKIAAIAAKLEDLTEEVDALSRGKLIKGFIYKRQLGTHVSEVVGETSATKKTWDTLRAAVEKAGGRSQRDSDGALAVYPAQGQRLFEVYDRG